MDIYLATLQLMAEEATWKMPGDYIGLQISNWGIRDIVKSVHSGTKERYLFDIRFEFP